MLTIKSYANDFTFDIRYPPTGQSYLIPITNNLFLLQNKIT